MCGICGIAYSTRSRRTIDPQLVERMRDTMVHRGPDGAGLLVRGNVALGHRRLSIVDVAHGAQPMASDDGQLHITYNGEVYNHPELMRDLQADGVQYRTHCDTESVLRLYERHGAKTPEMLRGMFAFAILDERSGEVFIARDRFGVKPLYYVLDGDGSLWFASEIKALLEAGAVRPALDAQALPDYLANHSTSGEGTLFAGVKRLLPGHTLRWKDGDVKITRYWDLDVAPDTTRRSEASWVEEYHERFDAAVKMRLMSDVPLGMFLSGGIDSAAITAAMSTMVSEPIKTFSVAFAEREANELYYARLVAQRYGTDHHEVIVSPAQFFEALPRMVWHEDEPIAHPSSIPLHFVSKLASERVKVVLTGEGSDETLAGYNRYRVTVANLAGGQVLSYAPGFMREGIRSAIDALPRKSRVRQKLSRTFLYLSGDLDTLYFDNFAVFSRARQQTLLAPALRAQLGEVNPYAKVHDLLAKHKSPTLLDSLLYADMKTYLHELLMKQDQMSMSASIESRVPFLDHPLVEFVTSMPQQLKLRGLTTKWVLRRAMKDLLPAEILSRKKMGFPVPIARWFRGEYTMLLDEYVLSPRALERGYFDAGAVREIVASHRNGIQDHSERLWSLVNLEMWHRQFIDGETVPPSPQRAPQLATTSYS